MNAEIPVENPAKPSPLEIWRMTATDRAEGGIPTTLALGAMVTGLAAEWFGPNEYTLGTVGSHTFLHTHNIYETGAATGGASFLIQTAVGLTVAWTLNRCPNAIDKLQERWNRSKKPEKDPLNDDVDEALSRPLLVASGSSLTLEAPEREKKTLAQTAAKMGRTAVQKAVTIGTEISGATKRTGKKITKTIGRPLVAGSGINLILEAPKKEREPFLRNAAKVVGWSAIVGAGVDLIGTGGAQLLVEGAEHGFESQAHFIVSDVLPNPLTYVAIVGAIYGATKGIKVAKGKLPAVLSAAKSLVLGSGKHLSRRLKRPTPTKM